MGNKTRSIWDLNWYEISDKNFTSFYGHWWHPVYRNRAGMKYLSYDFHIGKKCRYEIANRYDIIHDFHLTYYWWVLLLYFISIYGILYIVHLTTEADRGVPSKRVPSQQRETRRKGSDFRQPPVEKGLFSQLKKISPCWTKDNKSIKRMTVYYICVTHNGPIYFYVIEDFSWKSRPVTVLVCKIDVYKKFQIGKHHYIINSDMYLSNKGS